MKKFLALFLTDVVFIMLINVKMPTIVGILSFMSWIVFIMLINVKMATIVGILTFMNRINYFLSSVEHGKSLITSGPGYSGIVL